MVVFLARHRVRLSVVCCDVGKDGIDPVLAQQRPKAILPAVACEGSAIAKRELVVEIKLGRLPRLDAIFDLNPRRNKVIPAFLSHEG